MLGLSASREAYEEENAIQETMKNSRDGDTVTYDPVKQRTIEEETVDERRCKILAAAEKRRANTDTHTNARAQADRRMARSKQRTQVTNTIHNAIQTTTGTPKVSETSAETKKSQSIPVSNRIQMTNGTPLYINVLNDEYTVKFQNDILRGMKFRAVDYGGGGDCMYHSLAGILDMSGQRAVRDAMVKELRENGTRYTQKGRNGDGGVYDRFSTIQVDSTWGTTEDLEIASGAFKKCIFVASQTEGVWTVVDSNKMDCTLENSIFLLNVGNMHWQALVPMEAA